MEQSISKEDWQGILEAVKVSGMYAPVPNLCITMHNPFLQNNINVAKTFIHENVHHFQHLVSSTGLMTQITWRTIYSGIINIILGESSIDLPLRESLPRYINKLETDNSETAQALSFAFWYLANWSILGVAKTKSEEYIVSLVPCNI